MKFIAGLRVWGNWEIGENVLKVFLRLRGSANRRVDLFLPLIASKSGCNLIPCRGWRPMASFLRQQSNPTTTCATPRSRWNRSQSQSENETALNGKSTRFEQALRGGGRSLTPGWWIL